MTQLEYAKAKKITAPMQQVAREEGLDPESSLLKDRRRKNSPSVQYPPPP